MLAGTVLPVPVALPKLSEDHALLKQSPFKFPDAVQSIGSGAAIEDTIQRLYSELTNDERLSLLDGDVPFWEGLRGILYDRYNREPFIHGHIPRLGIPGIRFTDGPRGIVMGASTAFPVSMSRGATWDVDLEERIGVAIGREGRAQGANYYAGICINLPRHPAWGRIQETYGEDPILLGAFGAALTKGVKQNLMTCVKHFALNSMENARFRVDVQVDDAAFHEVYLAHFRKVIQDAEVDSVMSSYNSVRGEWAGQNKELLIDILRNQWGFDGFVLSDFIFGLRDAALSVKNGLDIEAPFRQQRAQSLHCALQDGTLDWSDVERACVHILGKQLQYADRVRGQVREREASSTVFCDDHRKLARESAARGMVLLKNDEVLGKKLLPIKPTTDQKIAIIGRLAESSNTGDRGSSHVHSPQVVSPVDGLRNALPGTEILVDDSDDAEQAARIAGRADLVVCIVGYDHCDEGEYVVPSFESDPALRELLPPTQSAKDQETYEYVTGSTANSGDDETAQDNIVPGAGGDRRSLRLRAQDLDIISKISAVNVNVIVTVVAAGPIIMEEWIDRVPAALMSWYSGCEGGHALADVLCGCIDASGRLPFSIPRDESHLPFYEIDTTSITYDRWFGQRLLDRLEVQARFPLGYGLSYTSFAISDIGVSPSEIQLGTDHFSVSATISNVGGVAGRFVAQVYGKPHLSNFPTCLLLGFATLDLQAGETKQVQVDASIRPLLRWTKAGWIRPGKFVEVEVAAYHGDPAAVKSHVLVGYASKRY